MKVLRGRQFEEEVTNAACKVGDVLYVGTNTGGLGQVKVGAAPTAHMADPDGGYCSPAILQWAYAGGEKNV